MNENNTFKLYQKYKYKYIRLKSKITKNLIGGENNIINYYKYIDYKSKQFDIDNNYYVANINPFNLSIIFDSTKNLFIGSIRTNIIDLLKIYNEDNTYKFINYINRKDNKKLTGEETENELVYHNELIIPGNSVQCKTFAHDNLDKPFGNYGSNFIWSNWQMVETSTKFITIDPQTFNTTELKLDITEICAKKYNAIYKSKLVKEEILNRCNINDARILTFNNLYIIHGHEINILYFVRLLDKNTITIYDIIVTKANITGNNLTFINLEKRDKDYYITYLDWFYNDGIKIKVINTLNNKIDEIIIPKKNAFIGTGKCDNQSKDIVYPLFSFSTPLVNIGKYLKLDSKLICWLGVGHIKIKNHKSCRYNNNTKLNNFRNNLHNNMYKRYGDKYKPHLGTVSYKSKIFEERIIPDCEGYIYMMYFYILTYNKETKEYDFKLSDSFLPLNVNKINDDKYKFSLFFPIGLIIKDDELLVSGGEGDYYSVIINFKLDWVINQLQYNNYKDLDMKDYDYKILEYNNDTTNIINDYATEIIFYSEEEKKIINNYSEENKKLLEDFMIYKPDLDSITFIIKNSKYKNQILKLYIDGNDEYIKKYSEILLQFFENDYEGIIFLSYFVKYPSFLSFIKYKPDKADLDCFVEYYNYNKDINIILQLLSSGEKQTGFGTYYEQKSIVPALYKLMEEH